ncbi:HoxN/HupN/NixA family nickel/cobalt transporter [Pseudoroseomonas ludipueritiae]|uniref:HoxN/HupN/NixA family nickel/cobalt transporter n=1 Tax=Pseudoroseomonas ludipueritiae TaxID=198093 RepID=UPI0036274D70
MSGSAQQRSAAHGYEVAAHEREHDHGHDHDHSHEGLGMSPSGFQVAHERAHTEEIRRRFTGRPVTTWQIVLFGLIGGLIPCPAAITVLLLCFPGGLAVAMASVGIAAAIGMRHAERRWSGPLDLVARRRRMPRRH